MLKAHLGHVTLYAENPDLLGAFYRDLFGMEIVGRATNGSRRIWPSTEPLQHP
jgi:catechol 2,3-dioxygenase-like lactoylglutathione lyase family enzyme